MQNFIKNKKGISVIEILLVITVLGIIFSIILPQFSKIRENQVIKSAVNDVLSSLNKAKTQTLASVNSSEYGVKFQNNQVLIFKGVVFNANDVNNEIVKIVTPASISSISLTAGATALYFNRLNGMPNATGTIIISSPNFIKTITISATGAFSVN